MYNDHEFNTQKPFNDPTTPSGNGIYYFIGALVLIVGIIGASAFWSPKSSEELASAPPAAQERTLPSTSTSPALPPTAAPQHTNPAPTAPGPQE